MLVIKNKCNMVELSFLKSGSKYICEFEVSSDFNLHIEFENKYQYDGAVCSR